KASGSRGQPRPCSRTLCAAIEAPADAPTPGPTGPEPPQKVSSPPLLGPASPSHPASRALLMASSNLWACASERGSIRTRVATANPATTAHTLLPDPLRAFSLILYPPPSAFSIGRPEIQPLAGNILREVLTGRGNARALRA